MRGKGRFHRNRLVFDPKTGQYLVSTPKGNAYAVWTPDAEQASRYSSGVITTLTRNWPYIRDCEIIEVSS